MKRKYIVPMLLGLLSFFIISCKKAPTCTGNCTEIVSNGRVIDKIASTGAPDMPVTLVWIKYGGGIFNDEVIQKVHSNADGLFNFISNIDTAYFSKGYHLALKVNDSKIYKVLGYSGINNIESYNFSPNIFRNKQLEVYKKAKLQININRSFNDDFIKYQIQYSNVSDFFLNAYYLLSPQEIGNKNKIVDLETVADIYTKIRIDKTLANGTTSVTLDSVKCTGTSTTIYNVNF